MGIDLSLDAGEFVTLCGPSGSGKSTLLRCCKSLLTPNGTLKGSRCFQGIPLEETDQRSQIARIGYVGQSPAGQVVTDKVWHELAFGPENLGWDRDTIRRRVTEMASFFGIQSWFYREVSSLSGGQLQLLALAAVMVLSPDLLLLDEPTSQLDPIAAGNFLEMLAKLNRELGTTILLSEHRLEEAVPLSDRLVVMEEGRLLCQGTPREAGMTLAKLSHPMGASLPAPMAIWSQVPNDQPCPVTVREGRAWLEAYAEDHPLAALPPETLPLPGDELLRGEDLWFRYDRDGEYIIKGCSLSVRRGELTALLGGNGSGKTTVLHLLAGVYAPQRGKCVRGTRVALLPQDPQAVFLKKTVKEDLLAQMEEMAVPLEEQQVQLEEVSALCALDGLLERHPYDLSGGEQQRAALARVLLTQPMVLLLDEPTKGLDRAFQEKLADILQTLLDRGVGILMVSHDMDFCARHAHRCALFFDGEIVTQGSPRTFFSGNRFYTTATNRMARELLPQAVTPDEVAVSCGGREQRFSKQIQQKSPEIPVSMLPPVAPMLPPVCVKKRPRWEPIVTVGLFLLLIVLTLFVGERLLGGRKYYVVALLILLEGTIPFFLSFERRRPSARELVLLSVLCALGVIGRAAFFMAPQCKPVAALTILTGVGLGKEAGFLVGSMTMLVSNLFFGQGPWTPWQMFAMGCIGLMAGLLFRRRKKRPKGLRLCLFGFLAVVVIYGGIMNSASALIWAHTWDWGLILTYCLAGVPMDLVHGGCTAILLWLLAEPFLEKLARVEKKYGLRDEPPA